MPDDGGWDYGTNLDYMKEFADYWVNKFDWRKTEEKINKFKNFKSNIDGIDIHFIHEKGSGSNPKPLLRYNNKLPDEPTNKSFRASPFASSGMYFSFTIPVT